MIADDQDEKDFDPKAEKDVVDIDGLSDELEPEPEDDAVEAEEEADAF